MIAAHYIKGEFLIDFLSIIPLKEIAQMCGMESNIINKFADMLQLLKALRIMKILRKIQNSNYSSRYKAGAVIMFYLFVVVIYTHVIACLLWWFLRTDNLWVPPLDAGSFGGRIYDAS